MQYSLNADYAKEGDTGGSTKLDEPGAYVGRFIMAQAVVSSAKKTNGVEFTFEAQDGRTAKYLTLWTTSADGSELFGLKQLHAAMACMGVRQISSVQTQAKVYSHEAGQEVDMIVNAFPELINVPVGVVLQKELYTNGKGEDRDKLVLNTTFEAETRRTATERLDNTEPTAIAKILETLRVRDNRSSAKSPASTASTTPDGKAAPDIDFDDDIPF